MTTQTEALKLALEALDQLTNAADTFSVSGVYFNEEVWAKKCLSDAYFAINAIEQTLAKPEQEPVAWVPYLSDRADGVKGRYAIARWNPRGYREVWNLRRHEWGAYSDDVLSLEEADTLLRLITIPTRKVTSPQPPQPKETEQEPVAVTAEMARAFHRAISDGPLGQADEFEIQTGLEAAFAHITTPPQRKPLTYVDLRRIASQCGLGANEVSAQAQAKVDNFARAIEAAHDIGEKK